MDAVWQIEDPSILNFDFWARKYLCFCRLLHVKRVSLFIVIIAALTILYSIGELVVNGVDELNFESSMRIAVIPIEVFCTVWLYEGLKLNLKNLILPFLVFTLFHPILFAYLAWSEYVGYREKEGDAHEFAKRTLNTFGFIFKFFFDKVDQNDVHQRRDVILIMGTIHISAILMNVVFLGILIWCYKYLLDLDRARKRSGNNTITNKF